ncbi:enoyl-CoA hydratase-related protein [Achromobacter piechaudii]|uniref:Crotonyl-CoA hydratase n=1 Tax=Achromobacter piechaudii TaxID=72556 RepID=A0ABN7ETX0_9BURK|nr:enoyl-CoA hydratase-related protein [Achromobacter piechaudii]CAB3658795.1 Crotonyl-CoA hydratase [Achromobacter piechaudii]CAB3822745.1 Crotonyl-CoA hydratase [Achromobacter piechaudii]CAB3945345.1 Crotonyl-CoA hydratase [Achromobacter piechaudii]
MSSDSLMQSASVPQIHAHIDGAIGRLVIDNQPKKNALTFDMWASLPEQIGRLDTDPDVRVIVVEGAGGKAFASGSDISQFGEKRNNAENVKLYNDNVDRAISALASARKPTVARVLGYCFGGGVALALHCDLRYSSEDATFCIPAGKVGVGYNELWLQRLGWMVGPSNAKEIMFTARRYGSAEAFRMGLVTRVLGEPDFDQIVADIAGLAPLTHEASKIAIDAGARGFDQGRKASQDAIMRCFMSQDYVEGRDAFTAKRAPKFTGR